MTADRPRVDRAPARVRRIDACAATRDKPTPPLSLYDSTLARSRAMPASRGTA